MSETCQKLAFTHPIVVLKSGLKNNWMKKLDHVNRPLHYNNMKTASIFIKHILDTFVMYYDVARQNKHSFLQNAL